MKAVGIIVEYNPFHNGHLRHLNETKKMFKNDIVIAVMSGNFTQRGDTSVIDKQSKTEIALKAGIDIVVELPFHYATQSADLFAKGSIEILKHLKVNNIVFGSESNNIDELTNIAKNTISSKEYDSLIIKGLSKGQNYPKSSFEALKEITNIDINKPNDILGICYIKEIKKQKAKILPNTIMRTSDYHSLEIDEVASATSIRNAIINKKNIDKALPKYVINYLKHPSFIDNYFDLLKYKILSTNNLDLYQGVDEGLENRINKFIINSNSLDELIDNLKTKRYSYNKIKRMLTHILVGFTKEENKKFKNINYIRVLGFNTKGQQYLNSIKKKLKLPLITNYSKYKDLLILDYKATCIYASIFENKYKLNLIKNELNKPIIKK